MILERYAPACVAGGTNVPAPPGAIGILPSCCLVRLVLLLHAFDFEYGWQTACVGIVLHHDLLCFLFHIVLLVHLVLLDPL